MLFRDAQLILKDVQDELGLPLLETVEYIMDNQDEFSQKTLSAHRVFCREMAKLFAPVDAAEDRPAPSYMSARESAIDEQAALYDDQYDNQY
jgi:hypothetical protein